MKTMNTKYDASQCKSRKWDVYWTETYEMNCEIEAASFEEALKKASIIRSEGPSLTASDQWSPETEDDPAVLNVDGIHVGALFEACSALDITPLSNEED